MSLDEGYGDSPTGDALIPQLLPLLEATGHTIPSLARAAGLDPLDAYRALTEGRCAIERNLTTLHQLVTPIGLTGDFFVTGDAGNYALYQSARTARVEKLVWEYIFKAELPRDDWAKLMAYCLGVKLNRSETNVRQAARPLPIYKWTDVARYCEEMRRRGW